MEGDIIYKVSSVVLTVFLLVACTSCQEGKLQLSMLTFVLFSFRTILAGVLHVVAIITDA